MVAKKGKRIGTGNGTAQDLRTENFVRGLYSGSHLDMALDAEIMLKFNHIFNKDKVLNKIRSEENKNGTD